MTALSRTILFVSSYAPLLFLFALLESFGKGWPSTVCFVLGAASIASLGILLVALRATLSPEQVDFAGARSRDADVMAYVVTYVVPFAAATDETPQPTRVALALFAGLIAILYIRSAVYYVHPLLLLYGIHVYEVSRDGAPCIVLTRQRQLRQQESMRVIHIGQSVYMEKTT